MKHKGKRYSNSIERTFEISINKPVRGLRAIKVVVVLLLAAVVVGTVIFGARLYFKGGESRDSASTVETTEGSMNDMLLMVVNKSNPLEKDYVPELVERDGYSVSPLADESLTSLLKAAEEKGIKLSVESAYISYSEQNKLYNAKFKYNRSHFGLTEVRAQAKTEADVPQAGNSEAQTGLLVTFKTDGKFKGSKASRWLKDNCINFGFIQRYPSDKTDSTSMNANEKVYRYVGKENAKMMRSLNKSLNEYVIYINSR